MTNLIFHHDAPRLPLVTPGVIPVLMYGAGPPRRRTGSIGGAVRSAVRRLGVRVPERAHDLLTVAMAVTAADTFANRETVEGQREAADGWTRDLRLRIPLENPAPWQPLRPLLEEALHFLSGDLWTLEFLPDGPLRPVPLRRGARTKLHGHDSVCLFSGGLDSAVGALDLLAAGRRPILVSHSYRGDAEKQEWIWGRLPTKVSRFAANAHPVSDLGHLNDVQMRTRSFNFLAYGALVAATLAQQGLVQEPIGLIVPENGFIALNPPLTARRIGALSTRTTHPHFLDLVQRLLDELGLPVRISNPYALSTKGEMLRCCANQATLAAIAHETVSCGKWKRTGKQCGKCVPCLIRRASFHAAGMQDPTPYEPYNQDLAAVLPREEAADDLMALVLAAKRLPTTDIGRWVGRTGPLPTDLDKRGLLLDVAHRGMAEVRAYLSSIGLIT
ncbi:7-cyano-7-deazaguanine synthase [Azospirillum sp. YIM DDC1]|uniref:7-cyano-7-deazaguanine synthase n=1 Tax=Azospirillum aestuarii TaxID=2802052 RepID=A0ABS1HS41_9PROT|nr:7-cyano-7-deazaguanine synthase [Azospirillum aestuarii]